MPDEPFDLKEFARKVGQMPSSHSGMPALLDRPEPEEPSEMFDEESIQVPSMTVHPKGAVDGIQDMKRIKYIGHRPVTLNFISAGAVDEKGRGLEVLEKLWIGASEEDLDWVKKLETPIPVITTPSTNPYGVEKSLHEILLREREKIEHSLILQLGMQRILPLVVDGSLAKTSGQSGMWGIVKTTQHRYLANEGVLYNLKAGWRSPRFIIRKQGRTRFSAYVRLFDASNESWNFGLIRVEAFDADDIDAAAAFALAGVQSSRADPRWDRHLGIVRAAEEFMRSRRPSFFSVSR